MGLSLVAINGSDNAYVDDCNMPISLNNKFNLKQVVNVNTLKKALVS